VLSTEDPLLIRNVHTVMGDSVLCLGENVTGLRAV
jgi:hypothetical protein